MRIALVTETYPPEINGVARTLGRVVEGLSARGHALQVVRPRQHRDDRPETGNPAELLVPGLPLPRYPELKFGLPSPLRLRRSWRASRPDVVHVATEGPLGLTALRAARALSIPVLSSYHTNFHVYAAHYGLGLFQRAGFAYLRALHNATARTLVPSDAILEVLEGHGFRNLALMPRGVDTALFSPGRRDRALRQSWGAGDDTPVVLYVGRLAPEKNIPLVVRAFESLRATCPEARLVLVGDGPARAELARRHPDYVYCGMRTGEDLARHYASGDLFLFGSVTETFGNVVTEAMASGLVLLAFHDGAARQHVQDGVHGRTVSLADEEAFVAAAVDLVSRREIWPALRQAARATALTLTWERVVSGLEGTYAAAMATAAPASSLAAEGGTP